MEKRAVEDSALRAGAQEVILIEEPMAAAIGVDLPVHEPSANMIIDIGGGTTEIAIISLGGIVESRSLRIAGDEFDECIVNYMRRTYNLMIGPRTAEEIKMTIGSAYPLGDHELEMEVRGRDQVAGFRSPSGSILLKSANVLLNRSNRSLKVSNSLLKNALLNLLQTLSNAEWCSQAAAP